MKNARYHETLSRNVLYGSNAPEPPEPSLYVTRIPLGGKKIGMTRDINIELDFNVPYLLSSNDLLNIAEERIKEEIIKNIFGRNNNPYKVNTSIDYQFPILNKTFETILNLNQLIDEVKNSWWDITTEYETNFFCVQKRSPERYWDGKNSSVSQIGHGVRPTGNIQENSRLLAKLFFLPPSHYTFVPSMFTELINRFRKNHSFFRERESFQKNKRKFCYVVDASETENVLVIGDIHSSIRSFCKIMLENYEYFEEDSLKLRSNHKIVFTGDIIDRGFSIPILVLIVVLMLQNDSKNIIICHGNHEDSNTYARDGYKQELQAFRQINTQVDTIPMEDFMSYLPTCCVMKTKNKNKKILFVHGVCPYNSDDFVQNLNYALNNKSEFFEYTETTELSMWGDFTAQKNNTLEKNRKRGTGGVLSYDLGKQWMDSNGFIQCVTGHQDLVGYACFRQPNNDIEKYAEDAHPYSSISERGGQYDAWVLKDGPAWDATDSDKTDVTNNRIHTLSTAVYSKYDEKFLSNHFFMTIEMK